MSRAKLARQLPAIAMSTYCLLVLIEMMALTPLASIALLMIVIALVMGGAIFTVYGIAHAQRYPQVTRHALAGVIGCILSIFIACAGFAFLAGRAIPYQD